MYVLAFEKNIFAFPKCWRDTGKLSFPYRKGFNETFQLIFLIDNRKRFYELHKYTLLMPS